MIWRKAIAALFTATLLAGSVSAANSKGNLGFNVDATISGYFHPTLKRLMVIGLTHDSPAEKAGVKNGDYIVEFNALVIEGSPVRETVERFKNIQLGQHIILKLKRDKTLITVNFVAGP